MISSPQPVHLLPDWSRLPLGAIPRVLSTRLWRTGISSASLAEVRGFNSPRRNPHRSARRRCALRQSAFWALPSPRAGRGIDGPGTLFNSAQ